MFQSFKPKIFIEFSKFQLCFSFSQNVLLYTSPFFGRSPDCISDSPSRGRLDFHHSLLLRRVGPLQDGQVRADDRALSQLLRSHHDSGRQVKTSLGIFGKPVV